MSQRVQILGIISANTASILLWYLFVLIFAKKLNKKFFSPEKALYREYAFEKNGDVYVKVFKIKKWKDKLPQHVGKDGFSKRNLVKMCDLSQEYIDQFIVETCRAEWYHCICCVFFVVPLIFNTAIYGVPFSALVLATNVPFIMIQRYNRTRLKKLRRKSQLTL